MEKRRKVLGNIGRVFLGERFEDGALWHKGATKVENVALDERDFAYHFFFVAVEHFVFHFVYFSYDIVEAREAGFDERFDKRIQ